MDFLCLHDRVDPERVGLIGICGWGGLALNAAAADTRVKATVASNKELMLIPGAVHTDLYDGGGKGAIPFDKLEEFFRLYLKG